MSGTAILGENLIDDLVPTVDELRTDLYEDFGVTPRVVRLIRRQWSGTRRGEGTVTVTFEHVMEPAPLFVDKVRYRLMPHGKDLTGDAMLLEVSLTYTETELSGGTLAANEEFFYQISDARGQGVATDYFVPKEPPIVDRDQSIGWKVTLTHVEVPAS